MTSQIEMLRNLLQVLDAEPDNAAADKYNSPASDHGPIIELVGCSVLVRTVTMIYTGQLDAASADTLVLSDAAWIADTGRFATALETGVLSEVEPYPDRVFVNRGAVVDVTLWDHPLPREQK